MKKIILLLVILSFTSKNFGQSKNETSTREQAVYGELLGNGIVFSANYDFRFAKSQKGLGMHVGLGYFGLFSDGILTVPIGLNYLVGNAPNYFEAGLGVTYATFTGGDDFLDGDGTLIVPSVGYRYQPAGKGFFAKIQISPLIYAGEGGGGFFWGGVGVGYKF